MNRLLGGAVAGLIGGVCASMAMNGFHEAFETLSGAGDGEPQDRKDEAPRADEGSAGEPETETEPSTVRVAETLSSTAGHELSAGEKTVAGPAVHYAYGTLWGAAYGAVAEAWPGATTGTGVPFGAALWLFGDELALPALGLAKWPTRYPARRHLRALGAHLIYGLVADLVRRGVRSLFNDGPVARPWR